LQQVGRKVFESLPVGRKNRRMPMKKLRFIENKLVQVEDALLIFLIFVMSMLVLIQMFGRILQTGLYFGWMQELSQYILVYIAFLGGARAFYTYAHIRITLLTENLPPEKGKYVIYFSKLLSLAYNIIFFSMSILFIQHLFKIGQMTLTFSPNFPLAYLYIGLSVLFVISSLHILLHFKDRVATAVEEAAAMNKEVQI
jgi:TRAP-type C4-dicarboxylate transport system permease small subunit